MTAPLPAPRASGVTTTTAAPLYWARYGVSGAPPLVLLHGGPGADHAYLLPQMLELGDRFDLLFYDQRGGGRSRSEDRDPITWRTHVSDLAQLLRELVPGPFTVVGYSWGGLLALLYASEAFPDDPSEAAALPAPDRMVLIDPAPATGPLRDQFEAELAWRQRSPDVERLRRDLDASGLRQRDPAAFRRRAFEISVAGYFAQPERARELTPFRVIARVQQSVWASLAGVDLSGALPRVRAPTLVIHGREDPIPLESSRRIATALPRARLVVLDDCGHVPYVEAPAALFTAIRRFLEEHPPSPAE